MEVRDKKIFVQSVSAVLIIVVLFNVYRGVTVQKIGIPGFFEIVFNEDPASSSLNKGELPPLDDNPLPIPRKTTNDPAGLIEPDPADNVDDRHEPAFYPPEEPEYDITEAAVDLSGVWYGADGMEYEITQSGNTVYFTEYGLFGATSNGSGTYRNNTVTFDYETVLGTFGTATLSLSPNGRVLSGSANDKVAGTITQLYLSKY